jgi:hypothetical protein
MGYPVQIVGFEDQKIEVQVASMFAPPKLFVNAKPAANGAKRGEMLLRRSDGQDVTAAWKPKGFDLPQLVVEGKTISYVEPLQWYQWGAALLPLLLVPVGGALGGMLGALAAFVNAKILRLPQSDSVKYALIGAVTVGVFVLFTVIATALRGGAGR